MSCGVPRSRRETSDPFASDSSVSASVGCRSCPHGALHGTVGAGLRAGTTVPRATRSGGPATGERHAAGGSRGRGQRPVGTRRRTSGGITGNGGGHADALRGRGAGATGCFRSARCFWGSRCGGTVWTARVAGSSGGGRGRAARSRRDGNPGTRRVGLDRAGSCRARWRSRCRLDRARSCRAVRSGWTIRACRTDRPGRIRGKSRSSMSYRCPRRSGSADVIRSSSGAGLLSRVGLTGQCSVLSVSRPDSDGVRGQRHVIAHGVQQLQEQRAVRSLEHGSEHRRLDLG